MVKFVRLSSCPDYQSFTCTVEGSSVPPHRDHGFPVRAVVPGATAARSVKWLTEVEVSGEEADSHWQRADYKVHGPGALASWEGAEEEARGKLPPVLDFPVNSAICQPPDGKTISPGMLKVRGYALSGGGNGISRVDVSVDRGASWAEARIRGQDAEEEGRRWERERETEKETGHVARNYRSQCLLN